VNTRNQFVAAVAEFLYRITEPLLAPIRNFMPNLGGLDISPIILILIIMFIDRVITYYIYPSLFSPPEALTVRWTRRSLALARASQGHLEWSPDRLLGAIPPAGSASRCGCRRAAAVTTSTASRRWPTAAAW